MIYKKANIWLSLDEENEWLNRIYSTFIMWSSDRWGGEKIKSSLQLSEVEYMLNSIKCRVLKGKVTDYHTGHEWGEEEKKMCCFKMQNSNQAS